MERSYLLTLVALMALLMAACIVPPLSPSAAPGAPATLAPVSNPSWQQDWEKTLGAAKNEGNLMVLTSFGEARDTIAKAFNQKHGLGIEFMVGRDNDIAAKVQSERRAGLYLGDIYLSGTSSIQTFKDLGFLDPLKPVLVLPEDLDLAAWLDGDLRFVDREGMVLSYLVTASGPIYINTDIVKPDEIKSYRDLLNPKWKGKIVVLDPTMGSAGTTFFFLLWELMGPDFAGELAKQDLAITTDGRQQGEWLARGKYPVSGNMSADIYSQFVGAGAPIKPILPIEGTSVSSSKGGLALINKAPHPNAAKVFINWMLTKESQALISKLTDTPSRRLDVSHEWADPSKVIQPGIKYIDGDTEEALKKKQEMQKISKDVWNIRK